MTQKCNSVIDFSLVALVLVPLSFVTIGLLILIEIVLSAVVLFPINNVYFEQGELNPTTVMMYHSAVNVTHKERNPSENETN